MSSVRLPYRTRNFCEFCRTSISVPYIYKPYKTQPCGTSMYGQMHSRITRNGVFTFKFWELMEGTFSASLAAILHQDLRLRSLFRSLYCGQLMATLFLPVACIVKQQKKTNSAAESKTRRQSGELQSRPKTPRAAESVSSRRGFRKVAFGTRVEYILQSVSV